MSELKPKRVVIVDDSPAYCDLWSNFILERYADPAYVKSLDAWGDDGQL